MERLRRPVLNINPLMLREHTHYFYTQLLSLFILFFSDAGYLSRKLCVSLFGQFKTGDISENSEVTCHNSFKLKCKPYLKTSSCINNYAQAVCNCHKIRAIYSLIQLLLYDGLLFFSINQLGRFWS